MDDTSSIKATARRAGALYFLFLIVGLVDMFSFSHFIVPGDSTATARNIMAAEPAYRIGILTDFVALVLFIFLVVSLYNLLRGVNKWHATLMVLLVSVGVTIGLANLLNKLAPLILLSGADYLSVFTKPQLDALALGFLSLNSNGDTVDTAFWGLWLFPFGILVVKSGFFPRVLGTLLLLAGRKGFSEEVGLVRSGSRAAGRAQSRRTHPDGRIDVHVPCLCGVSYARGPEKPSTTETSTCAR